jgi:hypothetical protein
MCQNLACWNVKQISRLNMQIQYASIASCAYTIYEYICVTIKNVAWYLSFNHKYLTPYCLSFDCKLLVTCKRCWLWKSFIFYHNANPRMSCTFCAFYQFTPQIVRNSQVNQPSTGRLCIISVAHIPSNVIPPK